jgi:UDP-3-O-[3-hydroxymyristoyl] glucosamine N-acyltransferase
VSATVKELAELVQGRLHGDGAVVISAARSLSEAGTGDITFLEKLDNSRQLQKCPASAVVVPPGYPPNGVPVIEVTDPLNAFIAIYRFLHPPQAPELRGVDPSANVHPTARIGSGCHIHPFAVVGAHTMVGARTTLHAGVVVGRQCRLGDDVVLHPNVVVYDGTVLGNRVIIHSNAVIGADGFGYRFQNGKHEKVPQLAHIEIGDDVEIGACTTIDRGTFHPTRIGAGTKIDNQVQIGHNCRIGRHNVLVSQVGISGSCTTGDYVVLGGQVGVVAQVQIGEGAMVGAQAGVIKDVPAGERYLGSPAMSAGEMKRILTLLPRLPEMRRDLQMLKQRLDGTTGEETDS